MRHATKERRRAGRSSDRRGVILFGVLLLIGIGAYISSTLLLGVQATRGSADASIRGDAARALAWSGIEGAMAELASQRDNLLAGGEPELTERWTIEGGPGGRIGVVRFIPIVGDRVAISESARLDLNSASPEMLASLPGVDETLAQRIVARRDSLGPYQSVAELAGVPGVDAELLYGSGGQDLRGIGGEEDPADLFFADDADGLLSLLTVYSFEPNVQTGIESSEYRGTRRINLNLPWSSRLERAITRRFNAEAAGAIEGLMRSQGAFTSDRMLVEQLSALVPGAWPIWKIALDSLTTSDDEFRPGRVDIVRADARVLATLPGIDESSAESIVAERENLSDDDRLSVVWLLEGQLVSTDAFGQAIDHLSFRSLQWRVRVEAGFLPLDASAEDNGDIETPLQSRVVLEAVIDVASQRPRVAYVRDVTMLDAVRLIGSGELASALRIEAADIFEEAAEETMEMEEPERVRPAQAARSSGRAAASREEPAPDGDELPVRDRRLGRWRLPEND
ncbi:MAG: helix-hairpin-helix domain-containing protein [Phycisphaerales bacterium]|nr:helix-hairpin-helix domain-containing protein [Phycisphaerales bacterium]